MTQATNHKVGLGSGGGGRSPLYIYIYIWREKERERYVYTWGSVPLMWVHSVDCHPYHDYIIMILSVWADAIHFDQCTVWPGFFVYPYIISKSMFFCLSTVWPGCYIHIYIYIYICPDSIQFFLCKVWPGSYLYVYVCSNSMHLCLYTVSPWCYVYMKYKYTYKMHRFWKVSPVYGLALIIYIYIYNYICSDYAFFCLCTVWSGCYILYLHIHIQRFHALSPVYVFSCSGHRHCFITSTSNLCELPKLVSLEKWRLSSCHQIA